MAPKEVAPLGRCGFVAVGIALEEVCLWSMVGFAISYAQDTLRETVYFLWPAYQHTAAPSPATCLPTHCHAPHHNRLNI